MMPPLVFQFDGMAGVEARCDASFAREFFQAEYGYHAADELPPDLPRVLLDFRLDSASPEGFTRHTHKLLARWNYQIALRPGLIDLRVHGNRWAVSMVHHMLVHPSLRWLSAHSGTLLLHAGAVAKNGKSLLFTGQGGAGKTTTTSLILASGNQWQLHADDYVFVRRGPRSLAYVTRSHLYRDLLRWVPQVAARLTPWERVRLEFFGALRRASRERLKWPVRLGPRRLWPENEIAAGAVPAAILLLERADVSAPELIPVENLESAASALLEMNFGEARHFLNLLKKAGQLNESWLADWRETERNLILQALREIPSYRLVLPRIQTGGETRATLLPLLENLVSG